jgi:anaerobic selenocysteine-containing dehydrogenase
MTGWSGTLDNELSQSFVEINPEDAARLSVKNHEKIKIKTDMRNRN